MIERYAQEFGIRIVQAWGMTETSPLASVAWPQEHMSDWSRGRHHRGGADQGRPAPCPGVEISIRDESGMRSRPTVRQWATSCVRGPWVVDGYLHGQGVEHFTADGWFKTGDVAIRSAAGYFVIADRTKDLIKSGGEWISSVDMEDAVMADPDASSRRR